MSPVRRPVNPVHVLWVILVSAGIFFAGCAACWSLFVTLVPDSASPTPEPISVSDDLRLAYSLRSRCWSRSW